MPYRISKSFEIENGHILWKHPDRCRFPHGHSRTVEIILLADRLDENDMICDFKALKQAVYEFIDSWDHALCLNSEDTNLPLYQKAYAERIIVFPKVDPTSEVMAKRIYDEVKQRLEIAQANATAKPYRVPSGVKLERVRITETSSSWAEYSE